MIYYHKKIGGCGKFSFPGEIDFFRTRPWKGESRERRRGAVFGDLKLDHGRYEKNVIFPYLPVQNI